MKYNIIFFCVFFLFSSFLIAQSPIGVWETIDDKDGKASSHIEIYEVNGKLHGKVVKLLQDPEDTICTECSGDKKDQLIVGMEILWNLKKYKDYWSYGKILDPENGKTYKCNVSMESNEKLKLRGYIGFAALGRNQIWNRVR